MNKIWLIAKREYTTRVRNKMFLISTFLLPIVIIALAFGTAIIAEKGKDNHKIAVKDPNHIFKTVLTDSKNMKYEFVENVDTSNYEKKGYTEMLIFPIWDSKTELDYFIFSQKQIGIDAKNEIEKKITNAIQNKVLLDKGYAINILDSLKKTAPKSQIIEIGKNGLTSSSEAASIIGGACGFLLYILMLIYGQQVMTGVAEEKTSKIAEIIVSSVKPKQLMMGKIWGIGAVGITQFLLWIILLFGLMYVTQFLLPHHILEEASQLQQAHAMPGGVSAVNMHISESGQSYFDTKNMISNLPILKIIFCFLFYFIGGYLFYASLYAAVGAMASDDIKDAQSLSFPITIPIIFGIFIMQSAIKSPNSSLAFWGSMIPFTSPIVMMARISSGIDAWQIILSMLLLIGGFLFTGWMAGKIYRTGILMYGKKGTWKEMMKWVFARS